MTSERVATTLSLDSPVPLVVEEGPDTLIIVALILVLGVTAQVLADRFRVPSVLFLILAVVAGVLGARGVAGLSMEIAKWLVIVFVVLAIISFVL